MCVDRVNLVFMRFLLVVFLSLSFMNVNAQGKHNAVNILKILDERLGSELHYSSFYNSVYNGKHIRAVGKRTVTPRRYFKDSSNYSNGFIYSNFKVIAEVSRVDLDSVKDRTIYLYKDQQILKIVNANDSTIYTFSDSVLIQKESVVLGKKYKESFIYDDSTRLRYILIDYDGRRDTGWAFIYERLWSLKEGGLLQITLQPSIGGKFSHEWCRIKVDSQCKVVEVLGGSLKHICQENIFYHYVEGRLQCKVAETKCSFEKVPHKEICIYEYTARDLRIVTTPSGKNDERRCEWFHDGLPIRTSDCSRPENDESNGVFYEYYYQ